jgi:putative tryptophan/tyrosine transport system substrate-binding protein
MKKRFIGMMVILFVSLLIVTGCGKSSSGDGGDSVTIGVTQYVEHPSLDAAFEGFKQALADNGYEEGENVTYDVNYAQAEMSNSQSIAKKLVGDNVDLIFANSTPSAQSALNATDEIPIIFTSVTDPVGAGLVESFEKPGPNITGTSDTHPEAIPQTINFIVEQFSPKKIGVVYNSGEQNSIVQVDIIKAELEGTGVELVEASVSTSAEVKQATESLVGRADVIYIPTDNTVVSALDSVIGVAQEQDIPLFAGELDSMKKGALAASGFSYYDLGYETGEMAVEVLKGNKKPSEISVSYPKSMKLVINKDAAKEQGVEIKPEWEDMADFYEGE